LTLLATVVPKAALTLEACWSTVSPSDRVTVLVVVPMVMSMAPPLPVPTEPPEPVTVLLTRPTLTAVEPTAPPVKASFSVPAGEAGSESEADEVW
jgi:hypothetical protein